MEWLRAYEGGRGVAYILGIVGVFAPSVLAMYLLATAEFNQRDWPLTLLLSASIGASITAILIAASIVKETFDRADSPKKATSEEKKELMLDALIFGPILALFSQGFALSICVANTYPFPRYLQFAFLIAGGFAMLEAISAVAGRLRRNLKRYFAKRKEAATALQCHAEQDQSIGLPRQRS